MVVITKGVSGSTRPGPGLLEPGLMGTHFAYIGLLTLASGYTFTPIKYPSCDTLIGTNLQDRARSLGGESLGGLFTCELTGNAYTRSLLTQRQRRAKGPA